MRRLPRPPARAIPMRFGEHAPASRPTAITDDRVRTANSRRDRGSLPVYFHAEGEPRAIVLFLQRPIGNPLKVSQRRIGQVDGIEEGTHVAGHPLAHGPVELPMRVVEPIGTRGCGNLVDVGPVKIGRQSRREPGSLVGHG